MDYLNFGDSRANAATAEGRRPGPARTKRVLAALLLSTSLCGVTLAPAARAQGAEHVSSIQAQPLSAALLEFSNASGIDIFFDQSVVGNRTSSGLSGRHSVEEGLSRLISGSGLSYAFNGSGAVTISDRLAGSQAFVSDDGSLMLDTIDISAGGGAARPGEPFTPDTAYQTSGSVSHISREQLDRMPVQSAGDIFANTPGVIASGNRVGNSISPNIRGMQGMGRVKVTVDGTSQTTSSYRGYIGNRDETYIDPDMIGGVDITKGPDAAGDGGIGGKVAVRTLQPQDIIPEGKTSGFRIKGSIGGNSLKRPETGTSDTRDYNRFLSDDNWSGSLAAAGTSETFDYVAAISKRVEGNYFAGSDAAADRRDSAVVDPGHEVLNTSQDTLSVLLKGKFKWGDGHSLELGYNRYDSEHGELMELFFSTFWGSGIEREPNDTTVDTYTGKYRWQPSDNDLVDFRANLWFTDLDRVNNSFVPEGSNIGYGGSQIATWGADVANTAHLDTPLGGLRFDAGLGFSREDADAVQWEEWNGNRFVRWNTTGPSGMRNMVNAFATVEADVTDWMSVNGGLRYDYYDSEGKGYLAEYADKSESKLSPSVGVTFKPADGLQVFALYKEGFRAPTLRETHWNYQELLVNNPDLKGEKATDIEVGLNFMRDSVFRPGDNVRFKATYFDTHYDDYIVRAPVTTRQPYHWTNIEGADYKGFELSGRYDTGTWFVEAAYTRYDSIEYCNGGVCATPGNSTALGNDYNANYIPPDYSGVVTAGMRLFDRKLTLGTRIHFAGESFGSNWAEDSSGAGQVGANFTWPSYRIYDVFGSYAFNENTKLHFSVENVANTYYYDALVSAGIPSPGRTFRASLIAKF